MGIRGIINRMTRRPGWFRMLLPKNPISRQFGTDRGQAIDRYYIDRFFKEQEAFIRGDVLEIGELDYVRRFGKNVRTARYLHYDPVKDAQGIQGDLEKPGTLPEESFDCFICPQTFQYLYQVEKAVESTYRLLRKNGTVLATMPAVSKRSVGAHENWKEYWRFLDESMEKAFSKAFGSSNVEVKSYGNVAVLTAFLYGFAVHEIPKSTLDYKDIDFPMILTVKAVKR